METVIKELTKSKTLNKVIEELKDNGFRVFVNEKPSTYAFISINDNIGYMQDDRLEGITFSTVHIPSRNIGTGYRLEFNKSASIVDMAKIACNTICPNWARHDFGKVSKYKGFDDYFSKPLNNILKYIEV